jgi:hypothetical protein
MSIAILAYRKSSSQWFTEGTMKRIDRRKFLGASALAGTAAYAVPAPLPQETAAAKDVTRKLARYVVEAKREDAPAAVRKEATRTLLNWVGCGVGGSRHETVDIAIRALSPFSGPPQATVLGRKIGWTY